MKHYALILLLTLGLTSCNKTSKKAEEADDVTRYRALIIDGESNHGVWPKTTAMMADYLVSTGLFEVDIENSSGKDHIMTRWPV